MNLFIETGDIIVFLLSIVIFGAVMFICGSETSGRNFKKAWKSDRDLVIDWLDKYIGGDK